MGWGLNNTKWKWAGLDVKHWVHCDFIVPTYSCYVSCFSMGTTGAAHSEKLVSAFSFNAYGREVGL